MRHVYKFELLNDLESEVEFQIQQALRVFQNLPEEVLSKPALTGGWSIAQCLEHLNSYGRYYFPKIKSSIATSKIAHDDVLIKSTMIGNYFARLMEPKIGMMKFKAFKNHVPATSLDVHNVVAEFIEQQELLLHFLKQSKKMEINNIRIPISISPFIKLKLVDVFRFIVAHNKRHVLQAQKNIDPNYTSV